MFVLLGIHVLGFLEFVFGTLDRGFDGMLINLFLGDGVLGEYANLVTVDLGETVADGEPREWRCL